MRVILVKPQILTGLILMILLFVITNICIGILLLDAKTQLHQFQLLFESDMIPETEPEATCAIEYCIRDTNPALPVDQAAAIATAIVTSAERNGVDPFLVTRIVKKESEFIPSAKGKTNDHGLMQLQPKTFESVHTGDIYDIADNIEAGTRYFRKLYDRFGGDLRLALAAYNAGPSRTRERILAISGQYADDILAGYINFKGGRYYETIADNETIRPYCRG